MALKTNKTNNFKRLPKGQRTYLRRLKQAANSEGTVYHAPIQHVPFKKEAS